MGDGKQRKQRKQYVAHRIAPTPTATATSTTAAAATAAAPAAMRLSLSCCPTRLATAMWTSNARCTTMRSMMADTCPARFSWTSSQESQRPCGTIRTVFHVVQLCVRADWRGQQLGEETLHRRCRTHQLCAGCGEEGDRRLRLPPEFQLCHFPGGGTGSGMRMLSRRCHIRGGSRLAWACWLLGAIPDPGYSEAHCTRA